VKKKSVRFGPETKEEEDDEEEVDDDVDNEEKCNTSSQNESFGDGGSSVEECVFDFRGVQRDLEDYVTEMTPFQKLSAFFIDLKNDYLYFYISNIKSYT
jgi:hypothetical protein